MNPVPQSASVGQAILQIRAKGNREKYTVFALPNGDDEPIEISTLQEFDEDQLREEAAEILEEYSGSEVWLIYKTPNGNRKKVNKIFSLTNSNATMSGVTHYQSHMPQQQRTRPEVSAAVAKLPETAQMLIQMKDEQLWDSRELVRELRDQQRIDQDTIKRLTEENNKLQLDGRMREREFELEKREVEANKPKGLAGIMETVNGLPPEITLALINRFLPMPAAPQMPMGALPANAGLSANQNALIAEINKELAQMDEEKLTKLYGVLVYIKQGQIDLDNVLAVVHNAA